MWLVYFRFLNRFILKTCKLLGNACLQIQLVDPIAEFKVFQSLEKSLKNLCKTAQWIKYLPHTRNVIKFQSLTHCQFASMKFIIMFKHEYAKWGYIDKDEKCTTPTYCCLKIQEREQSYFEWVVQSVKEAFVRCAHSEKYGLFYILLRNEQRVKNWLLSMHVRTINKRKYCLLLWWYLIFNKQNLKLSLRALSLLKLYEYAR